MELQGWRTVQHLTQCGLTHECRSNAAKALQRLLEPNLGAAPLTDSSYKGSPFSTSPVSSAAVGISYAIVKSWSCIARLP